MTHLRIASWNIRAGLGRDLRRRPERTLAGITELTADVVLLQEADFRLAPRSSALPNITRAGMRPLSLSDDLSGIGWHGNAILVSKRFDHTDTQLVDLPGLEPRGAVIVEGQIDDAPLRIVATHLGLRRHDRRRQLRDLATRLDCLTQRPTILGGDLNERSASRGFESLPFGWTLLAPGPTYPAGWPIARFDRLALSPDWVVEDQAVANSPVTRIASDHRPIVADLRLVQHKLE